MIWLTVIVNLATLIIIIGGIFNATRKPGKPHWLFSKKFIRASVMASAVVAFSVNIYQAQQDEQQKNLLLNKLDYLTLRMQILDRKLIKNSDEKMQIGKIPTTTSLSRKKGNIAGFIKTLDGKGLAGVKITRISNNVQTTSHAGGDFIVTSVVEGESLIFQKNGYKEYNYRVLSLDFKRLVEIKIMEE